MRLTVKERESICKAFLLHFNKNGKLWLFGSRVDDLKKGGDIDLYIEIEKMTVEKAIDKKLSFVNDLWLALGEQKIDVILNLKSENVHLPIYEEARLHGVRLI